MSLLSLLLRMYTLAALVCALAVACEYVWFCYCAWVIQRERDHFWQCLCEHLTLQAQRYVVPAGPYR